MNIERVCSFIRAGSDPKTACLAAGMEQAQITPFLTDHAYWITRAQAQFVVLACNKMMTEGGAGGAKYLLERYAESHRIAAAPIPKDKRERGFSLSNFELQLDRI